MAWRECKPVVRTCALCAGIPTFLFWTLADALSKEPAGPLFWLVSAVVGTTVGAASGLIACVAAPSKGVRQLVGEPLDSIGAKIVDEQRAVSGLRYLIGIPLAMLSAMVCTVFFLDAIHNAMPWRW